MVKSITLKLFKENPEKFKKEFSENKKIVKVLVDAKSKKLENIIAGYMTRLYKQQ
jgi:ribosomal protein S17E